MSPRKSQSYQERRERMEQEQERKRELQQREQDRKRRDEYDRYHPEYPGVTGWIAIAVKWLFSQETVVVLLISIFLGLGYLINYLIKIGIPQHLHSIQTGYEKLSESHEREVRQIVQTLEEVRERDRATLIEILREQRGTKEAIKEAGEKIDRAVDEAVKNNF